jgi:hypothetical protein
MKEERKVNKKVNRKLGYTNLGGLQLGFIHLMGQNTKVCSWVLGHMGSH